MPIWRLSPFLSRRPQPVLAKPSPCPEGEEIEPFRDDISFDEMTVADLVEDEMQSHAAQDAEEDRVWEFIDQNAIEDKQLVGMEYQDDFVPASLIIP